MLEQSPAVSIILCTYNRKAFLADSIESLLKQTFQNFELILVDNGSTDSSDVLCEEYASKDSRIKVIHIDNNIGAANGRNIGIRSANCDYITFVDDDDYCYPDMLSFLWELSQEHQADIAMCGSWNKSGSHLEPYFIFEEKLVFNKIESLNELLLREKFNVAPPTKLFKKKLFEGISFKNGVHVDDIHVIYKIFARAEVIVVQGTPLYVFTKHSGNMTHFIQKEYPSPFIIEEYLQAFKERTEYLAVQVEEVVPRARYSEWSYMISMCKKIENKEDEYEELYNRMIKTLKKEFKEIITSPYLSNEERDFMRKISWDDRF